MDIYILLLSGVDRPVMDWATRVKIAVCAARGLAYLHEDCKTLNISSMITHLNLISSVYYFSSHVHA